MTQQDLSHNIDKSLSPEQHQELAELLLLNHCAFATDPNHCLFATDPEYPDAMRNVPAVHINTGHAKPIKCFPRRRHPLAHRFMDEHTQRLEKEGLIEPSNSSWSFPVVLAAKPKGGIRFCLDYRRLNDVTMEDAYTLPRLDDTLDRLHGAAYFSTLDAAAGFHQLPLHERSRPQTAFPSLRGHWQWTRLPFGVCNGPAIFQRVMDSVLGSLQFQCALVYLDDIIVCSSSFEQHLVDLQSVFNQLSKVNCQLKLPKCHFGAQEISFLGHQVSARGVSPQPRITNAISSFSSPTTNQGKKANVTAIRRFLAMVGFYRRFIRDFATTALPLQRLVRRNADLA